LASWWANGLNTLTEDNMAKNACVVDLSPRWVVIFRKNKEAFTLKFNQLDDMLIAVSRARGAGYEIKTLPVRLDKQTQGR
jgi:hypothetical protein